MRGRRKKEAFWPPTASKHLCVRMSCCVESIVIEPAEATCVSQIKTARAVAADMKSATPASVRRWARCNLATSERDVHRVVKSQKLSLHVPITNITVQGVRLPFIRSVDWLHFLVTEVNQWHRLAGLEQPSDENCCSVWKGFWKEYQHLHPEHEIFQRLSEDELSRTAACYFHLDEGRTLKRAGLMVMSFHSALGFGFLKQPKKRSRDGRPIRFKVNYTGATLTNRCLLSVIPKKYYEKAQRVLDDAFDLIGKDFASLVERGNPDREGHVHRICILGVKADWPAQVRCAGLLRSYNHGPKRQTSQNGNSGICHMCEAGLPGIPFEQIGCEQPVWSYSLGASLPWTTTPAIMRNLPHCPDFPAGFFCLDPWHVIHMGVAKSFISSAMVLALDLFPGRGVNTQLEQMTDSYRSWCKENKHAPFISKITKDTLTWKKRADEPAGSWNKGNLTSLFCRWFEAWCWRNQDRIPDGSLLHLAGQAVGFLNRFLELLYKSDVFIEKRRGMFIARQGLGFLNLYRVLARQAFESARQLFPLLPKTHSMDHVVHFMLAQCKMRGACYNPMVVGNQQEEDFIGRPSRLSRRVSPRLPATRTFQRYLIAARAACVKAGMMR